MDQEMASLKGTRPDRSPVLESLNGSAMAHWLVQCAIRRGTRCSHTTEGRWQRHWQVWVEFCALRGMASFPIELPKVEAFLVDCSLLGRKQSTVRRYLLTLKAVIDSVDAADPLDTDEGKAAIRRVMTVYFGESVVDQAMQRPPQQVEPTMPVIRPPPERFQMEEGQTAEEGTDVIQIELPAAQAASNSIEPVSPPPESPGRTSWPAPALEYHLPEDYGRPWWTHRSRVKEQARATWAARRAMRLRTPERFALLRLAIREIELGDSGYSDIGSAILRGCVGGAGGFSAVASRTGISVSELKAAFARDELPPPKVVHGLLRYFFRDWTTSA